METPTLGALLAETAARARGPMKTAIPAVVVAYNPALQTCTAKPTVSGRYQDAETDVLVPFALPTISNVPVLFPAGGGCSITWPLVPGDVVYLVIADRSLDEWKSTGAPECVPQDVRRFDLTDAVAIPGLRPFTTPLPASGWSPAGVVISGPQVLLGSSAASSPVVLETLLAPFLATLKTWLDTHTHLGVAPGAPGTPPLPLSPVVGSVGATKVRAE